MVTWEEIARRYLVKHRNQIAKVTQPLIDFFDVLEVVYIKTYNDGRFTYLSPYNKITEFYLSEHLYRNDPYFRHPDYFQSGFRWYENVGSKDFQENICQMNHLFNVHSPLLMIEKGLDYSEIFYFSGRTDAAMQTLHLQHSQLLKSFATYYKNELGSILRQMEEEEFSLIDLQGESFFTANKEPSVDTQSIHSFLIALGKKAQVERASSLSQRERDCLRLLIHGNSAKDSAHELNLSHRTVESYLENIKNKLNCCSKRELFSLGIELQNLGLF